MALVLESSPRQLSSCPSTTSPFGQRSHSVHGVAEAARIFFGKDVSNLSLAEAATIAGLIPSPSTTLAIPPIFEQAQERRNVVLRQMASAGFITADAATRAVAEPLKITVARARSESASCVDYVSQQVDEKYSGLLQTTSAVDVFTTLNLHLQRLAQEALADGIVQVDKQLAARKRKGPAEAALIAVDPRTGQMRMRHVYVALTRYEYVCSALRACRRLENFPRRI